MARSDGEPAGRCALVTGAGSGIGAACARALARAGAKVALAGRRLDPLEALAREIDDQDGEALAFSCDVTRPDQVARAVGFFSSALGPIEIVVNGAGIAHSATLAATTDEDIDRVLDANLRGAWNVVRAVVGPMRRAKFGRIVNVGSTASVRGYRFNALYAASKHALAGLTRSLSAELLPDGITVNTVCPGFTDTAIVQDAARTISEKTGRSGKEAVAALAAQNPIGRLVDPDEVAGTVLWLVGDGGAAVSGQSIVIDGGTVQV
jgi:NAD(P)-dependent dehydrogenase (short-subunit alcohol dehydrogenase family)